MILVEEKRHGDEKGEMNEGRGERIVLEMASVDAIDALAVGHHIAMVGGDSDYDDSTSSSSL
jgi:arginyl-tRNA synthetase